MNSFFWAGCAKYLCPHLLFAVSEAGRAWGWHSKEKVKILTLAWWMLTCIWQISICNLIFTWQHLTCQPIFLYNFSNSVLLNEQFGDNETLKAIVWFLFGFEHFLLVAVLRRPYWIKCRSCVDLQTQVWIFIVSAFMCWLKGHMQLQLTMQLLPPFCNSVYAFSRDLAVVDNEYFPGNDGRLEERARTNMYCTKCLGTSLITRHKTLASDKRPRVRGIFSDMLKMSPTHHLPSVRQK